MCEHNNLDLEIDKKPAEKFAEFGLLENEPFIDHISRINSDITKRKFL